MLLRITKSVIFKNMRSNNAHVPKTEQQQSTKTMNAQNSLFTIRLTPEICMYIDIYLQFRLKMSNVDNLVI